MTSALILKPATKPSRSDDFHLIGNVTQGRNLRFR
jgi:hypothetical protein